MLPLSQVHSIPMQFLGIVEIESIETGVHMKMYAHHGLELTNLQSPQPTLLFDSPAQHSSSIHTHHLAHMENILPE
ncbi:hypothetical protein AA0116_g10877 [Alternaria tenuissima]|jgi:hypothetical protein|nr:hypothetical protein AA0116_g10877 [Alternaria tenuissima]